MFSPLHSNFLINTGDGDRRRPRRPGRGRARRREGQDRHRAPLGDQADRDALGWPPRRSSWCATRARRSTRTYRRRSGSCAPTGSRRPAELAERLARFAPIACVTSAERKAQETAQVLADRLKLPLEVDPGLVEHKRQHPSFGTEEEFQARIAEVFAHPHQPAPGGESAEQACERLAQALARHKRPAAGGGHPRHGAQPLRRPPPRPRRPRPLAQPPHPRRLRLRRRGRADRAADFGRPGCYAASAFSAGTSLALAVAFATTVPLRSISLPSRKAMLLPACTTWPSP